MAGKSKSSLPSTKMQCHVSSQCPFHVTDLPKGWCEKTNTMYAQYKVLGNPYMSRIKKFNERNREVCQLVEDGKKTWLQNTSVTKNFCNGSQYIGEANHLDINGKGTFEFSHGVIYEGNFKNGVFHGHGVYKYPVSKNEITVKSENGVAVKKYLTFSDGLQYDDEHHWKYINENDRRYPAEYKDGIRPAGDSYIVPRPPEKKLQEHFYDTINGVYDDTSGFILNEHNFKDILRCPHPEERKWITENCYTNLERPIGPQSQLYKEFVTPTPYLQKPPLPASHMKGVHGIVITPSPPASIAEETLSTQKQKHCKGICAKKMKELMRKHQKEKEVLFRKEQELQKALLQKEKEEQEKHVF